MRHGYLGFGWKGGFTLLEVVVAMAIVGLGVVTLLEIFSGGLRLGSRSVARTEAVTVGRQVMDEVWVQQEVRDGGEEGYVKDGLRWRLQTGPLSSDDAKFLPRGWTLKEIVLRVQYREGEREKAVEMRTLRLVKTEGP